MIEAARHVSEISVSSRLYNPILERMPRSVSASVAAVGTPWTGRTTSTPILIRVPLRRSVVYEYLVRPVGVLFSGATDMHTKHCGEHVRRIDLPAAASRTTHNNW
jgi:hypothetical protein